MDRHIVVTGGGGFWTGADGRLLEEFIFDLTGAPRPRVCHVPTASGDSESYIQGFETHLGSRCVVSHLTVFRPTIAPYAELLADQDVIYVGGGSTPNLLALWRLHGLDALIRDAWENGTVLCGSSAGGLCWFESGLTDSLGGDGSLRPLLDGLGFLAGSYCPHYDTEPDRRSMYRRLVAERLLPMGYAADDHAALHFIGTELAEVVVSQPTAHAYRVEPVPSGVSEVPIAQHRLA